MSKFTINPIEFNQKFMLAELDLLAELLVKRRKRLKRERRELRVFMARLRQCGLQSQLESVRRDVRNIKADIRRLDGIEQKLWGRG